MHEGQNKGDKGSCSFYFKPSIKGRWLGLALIILLGHPHERLPHPPSRWEHFLWVIEIHDIPTEISVQKYVQKMVYTQSFKGF